MARAIAVDIHGILTHAGNGCYGEVCRITVLYEATPLDVGGNVTDEPAGSVDPSTFGDRVHGTVRCVRCGLLMHRDDDPADDTTVDAESVDVGDA